MSKIIIFSGAGLDAPSGIRTFRDSNGLWNEHKIDDVCNERTWINNYELVHEFYNERRKDLKNVSPNKAHKVLKEIEQEFDNVINITMNVSDLLDRENISNTKLHGDLTKMECSKCGHIFDIGYEMYDKERKCPKCNGYRTVKPHIVFFGGQAPNYKVLYEVFGEPFTEDDIIIVIGTLGNVVPIQSLIRYKDCKKILCNMEKSMYLSEEFFDEVYYESIETAIPKIKDFIKDVRGVY